MSITVDTEFDKMMKEHEKMSGALKASLGGDKFCWDAGLEITKNCGDYDGGSYSVIFSALSDEKIKILMKKFVRLEWLGYLLGEVDHVKRYIYVEDFIIPKQRVSYGMVDNVDYQWNQGLNIIGVMHSHHGMGAFFSGTDDAYINQNHDVSIVVSTKPGKEIKAQVRIKMKCNKYFINEDMKFYVNSPVVLDVTDFMNIIEQNISVPVSSGSPINVTSSNRVSGNMSSRIGFTPFDSLDEDYDDFDDEDEEDDDFVEDIMSDIIKRDISTLGSPLQNKNEHVWGSDITPPSSFIDTITKNKIGSWLF